MIHVPTQSNLFELIWCIWEKIPLFFRNITNHDKFNGFAHYSNGEDISQQARHLRDFLKSFGAHVTKKRLSHFCESDFLFDRWSSYPCHLSHTLFRFGQTKEGRRRRLASRFPSASLLPKTYTSSWAMFILTGFSSFVHRTWHAIQPCMKRCYCALSTTQVSIACNLGHTIRFKAEGWNKPKEEGEEERTQAHTHPVSYRL